MKNSRKLKQHASARIKYCWGESVMIFFITVGGFAAFIITWMIINNISGAITNLYDIIVSSVMEMLLLWLVFTPFSYGVKWYRIQQIRGQQVPARGIFSCYMSMSRMLDVFCLDIAITLRRLGVIIPAAAAAAAAYYLYANGGNIILYCAAAAFMLIFAGLLVLYVAADIRYSLIIFAYVLKPDVPIKDLIRESKRLVKGKTGYCIKVMLSLTGLFILCLLIFPAVFIVPYMQMVYAAMINELIRQEEIYADHEAG